MRVMVLEMELKIRILRKIKRKRKFQFANRSTMEYVLYKSYNHKMHPNKTNTMLTHIETKKNGLWIMNEET